MYRQIIGYIPSNIVPAVVSMVMIYAYTRLLSPAAFGSYTYVFSAILILQTSLFYALPIAVMRFYPAATISGRRDDLLKEAYVVFYALCGAVCLLWVGAGLLVNLPAQYRAPIWLALPLLLFRSLVQLNQAINRSGNNMRRFNTIECLHAVLGFGLGFSALFVLGRGADAILTGLLIAAILCASIDLRLLAVPFRRAAKVLDRAELVRLVEYSWPMVAVAATAMIMQNSDRFLLGSLAGTEMLGIFAVAYNLVERPTTVICSSISTATFPLVVQVLEHQGKEAARLQAGRNGIALLAVTLPACVGLAFTADYVASSLVGPAFRDGVATLIPIMSLTALARGLRAHFIDHAFHLSGRPLMMLWTYAPATLLNIGLNLYVIPRYGMLGAAWTAFACQCGIVVAGWFVGTSVFPVWLPVWQVVRCVAAVVPMIIGLSLIRFPLNWFGLLAAVLLGSAIYLVSAIVLDVGEVRTLGWNALRRRIRPNIAVLTD
ncbi:oligosaccharide flippase family protein [Rhodopila sp.]|uniref:oligosaccharide flippase family protein n=1 Tax=Rhodopila sp. TaxID=2480087 RepID=UPI003D120B18